MKFRLTFSNGFLAENPWCDGEPVELETEADNWSRLRASERETILRHWRDGTVVVQKGDPFDGFLNLKLLTCMAARGFERNREIEKYNEKRRKLWEEIIALQSPAPSIWRRVLTRIRDLFPFWK